MVLGWRQSGDSLHLAVARRAAELSNRLPPRERALVEGYADLTIALIAEGRGDTILARSKFPSAQAHYAAAIARDSGDAEAWYGIGDAYWHHRVDGWGGRATVVNWTRALRAFNRTIALDSTFYLAYSHKIDVYRQAAGQVPTLLLEGDSLRLLDTAIARRPAGMAQLAASQRRAFDLASHDARAWVQSAPSVAAYQSLAILYRTRGHPDSAVAVLRESLNRPDTHGPQTPFQLAFMQTIVDPIAATRVLRDALRTTDERRLAVEGSANLIEYLLGAGAAAAITGNLTMVDSVASLAARTVRPPSALELREDPRPRLWSIGVKLAAGVPPRTVNAPLQASLATVARTPKGTGDYLRAQSVATLYVAYLATRDARTLALLREWRGSQLPYQELDALAALDARDTTAAARAVKLFPSADSVRTARGPMGVPRWIARAHAYEALGDLRGAVAAYSVLEPRLFSPMGQADPSWPLYTRSFLWRGQLLERLNDRPASIEAYRRFLALWAEADPALEPQRELARAALRRLGQAP